MTQVLCFDPTSSDQQSKVRGVGRYLQILKENFTDWIFSNKLQVTSYKLQVFINPFFNFLQKPTTFKRIAKKQIAVIHDLIPLKYPDKFPAGIRGNFNIFLNKLALKNYDLIITDSQTSKKDIIRILKVPEEKIKVIYPCLPKIFSALKIKNLKLKIKNFILYVGDATWNKNLLYLAKAIKIANVTCVFVGKIFENFKKLHVTRYTLHFNHPWQKELKEFFNLTKNDRRFIFSGYIPDKELIKLYQKANLNILPSFDEGFGFSYLEAASQQCPSVLSDIPVFREIASDTALFANPKNPNDLADKIIELYFDKDRQKILGETAKKRVDFFSCKKFRKSFLEVVPH